MHNIMLINLLNLKTRLTTAENVFVSILTAVLTTFSITVLACAIMLSQHLPKATHDYMICLNFTAIIVALMISALAWFKTKNAKKQKSFSEITEDDLKTISNDPGDYSYLIKVANHRAKVSTIEHYSMDYWPPLANSHAEEYYEDTRHNIFCNLIDVHTNAQTYK